ncbi:hypothetical protein NPIL_630321, partial [Nephila pilipes]
LQRYKGPKRRRDPKRRHQRWFPTFLLSLGSTPSLLPYDSK